MGGGGREGPVILALLPQVYEGNAVHGRRYSTGCVCVGGGGYEHWSVPRVDRVLICCTLSADPRGFCNPVFPGGPLK